VSDNGAELAELLAAPLDPRTVPVRFSNLKHMGLSAEHYLHALRTPYRSSAAQQLGSAVDAMVYGTNEVVAYPGSVRRGKEYERFLSEHAESLVLTKKELQLAEGMARGLERNRHAVLLRDGERQRTIHWRLGGRECQGTPDNFSSAAITDLKTSKSSDPDRFRWDARRYAYHAQLAWYREGLIRSGLATPEAAYIVAVESRAPHTTTVFRLTEQALDLGTRIWRLWWERLMVSEQSDLWPGYRDGVVDLDFADEDGEVFSLTIDGEDLEIE
jgi:hypothetical protein